MLGRDGDGTKKKKNRERVSRGGVKIESREVEKVHEEEVKELKSRQRHGIFYQMSTLG